MFPLIWECKNAATFRIAGQQDFLTRSIRSSTKLCGQSGKPSRLSGSGRRGRRVSDLYPTPAPSTPSVVREEAVELAALSWFELIGWRRYLAIISRPTGPMGARASYRDAVLEPELRSALARLNPEATPGDDRRGGARGAGDA